jgi:hypothetical protein
MIDRRTRRLGLAVLGRRRGITVGFEGHLQQLRCLIAQACPGRSSSLARDGDNCCRRSCNRVETLLGCDDGTEAAAAQKLSEETGRPQRRGKCDHRPAVGCQTSWAAAATCRGMDGRKEKGRSKNAAAQFVACRGFEPISSDRARDDGSRACRSGPAERRAPDCRCRCAVYSRRSRCRLPKRESSRYSPRTGIRA